MSSRSGHSVSALVSLSHRRGMISLGGCLLAMVLAAAVTDALDTGVILVLLGVLSATAAAFGLVIVTGQAGNRWSLILWPVAMCFGISALDHVAPEASVLVMGFVTLSFLFVGLSQPPLRGLWFVPPASLVFLQVQDPTLEMAAIRLPIVAIIWIICAEVPARLIAQLREKQAALELLATTDSLTGLLNRSSLGLQLERVGEVGVVAMIDLDHFKQFNDRYGHLAGDVALMDFAAVLRDGVRPGDQVFRYGGEEFLVVLDKITPSDAAGVLARVRDTWAAHHSGLTFSAGLARGGLAGLRGADALLYQAKAEGRDRIVVEPTSTDTSDVISSGL